MEQNFVSLENFTDFVYYDTEFDKSPPARDWCAHLVPWWGAGVGQASLLLILLILYRLFRLCPSLNCPHAANILTLYVNLSLWVWVVFLILAFTTCSIGLNNALVITAIVFVAVFGLGSVLDCFFGTEGWYLVDLKHMTDAIHQLEKMKTSPPVHRVHIECFHTETFTLFNTRGKFFTRSRKVVTYTDHRDFPFSSWSDVSDWPVLETIANQGILIIGMSIERLVEPGDPDTNQAFINFRNRFVQQNCHRDEQVRTWVTSEIPDIGTDPSLFISTKPKEQMPFIFKIGVFLILSSFCLSCPLKTLIRKKTKLIPLKVRKVYFADPDKLSPYLGLMNNGPGHTTNSGFGAKGSMLHNGSHSMQKVLLDAALNQHENLLDSNPLNNTLHALTPNLDVGENLIYKNICKPGNQKFVLLSPMIGSKPMILSPIFESRDERKEQSGFVLLPVQTFENTLPIPTFREQTNTDTNIQTQSRQTLTHKHSDQRYLNLFSSFTVFLILIRLS